MRFLITGSNGTLGKAMCRYLSLAGHTPIGWDRKAASPFIYEEMLNYVRSVQPDIIFHFAIASSPTGKENEDWAINYEWSGELAWICRTERIPFLFTGTVMVFSDAKNGPFSKESKPDANEGYGFQKRLAEERVRYQNPDAYIVRLGWQIDTIFSGNNMLAYFEHKNSELGYIPASKYWYPACSFVQDTVIELVRIIEEEEPGLFMIDSNNGFSFFTVASALNALYGNRWNIREDNNFVYNQQMKDSRCQIPKLSARLGMDPSKNKDDVPNITEIF